MKRSKLNLSLKRRTKIIDDTMPKRKRGGEIKMKTVDLTESPSKRQTLITNFYVSPRKPNDLPPKFVSSSADVSSSTSTQANGIAIGASSECIDDSLSLYQHSSDSDVVILDDEEIPNLNKTEATVDLSQNSGSVDKAFRLITQECKDENLEPPKTPVKNHQNRFVNNSVPRVNGTYIGKGIADMSEKLNGEISSPKMIRVRPREELLSDRVLSNMSSFKSPQKVQTTPKKVSKSVSPKNKIQPLSQIGSVGEVVRISPIKIQGKPHEELLSNQILSNMSTSFISPQKIQTTPKKANKSVSPKNQNQPLSQIGSDGEVVRISPIKIQVKPHEELLSNQILSNMSTSFISPQKIQTTPKKANKSVSPKNKNQPLSQIGSNGEVVRFSPKIKRRPGKYFDGQTMPDELMKSPVSKKQSPKKSLTPRKRNLLKEFENITGQTYVNNYYPSEMVFTDESWQVFENLINNPEAMEEIRVKNAQKQSTTSPVVEKQVDVQQQSTSASPSKVKSKKQNPNDVQESFVHYLLTNPMITVADQRHILDDSAFQEMVSLFRRLSPSCLQIYAKMYTRTPVWYRVESDLIKRYKDTIDDITGVVATLTQYKFISDDLSNVELLDLLNLLLLQELKNVCNDFKVGKGNGMKKDNLVKILLNHACSQGVIFSKVNMSDKIKARVIKELGSCVRLTEVYRQMFNLLVILATYPYHMDEEKMRLNNLIKILNDVKMRRKTFPMYVFRPEVGFQDINQLNAYGEASTFVAEYSNYVETKDWGSASQKVIEAKERFTSFLADERNIDLLNRLGGHLVKFTAGYQYAYCLSDGISVLKKDLKYSDKCIEVIDELLSQRRYIQRKRGIWYDELALVYQSKKKDLVSACMTVKRGLEDSKVDKIRKLLLSQRAATLIKRKSSTISDGLRAELSALMLRDPYQPQQHTITAKSHEGVAGRKQVFYRECDDGKEYSSVEEIVIDYYKNTASPSYQLGLHDEGRTLMNIILACFYDVIYDHPEGESMFHCPMQTRPLDWGGYHFYTRRKQQIQDTLDRLRAGGVFEIMTTLQKIVSNSEDVDCVVNWEYIRPDKLHKIKDLLECIGVEVFVNIAEHVISDYKTYHSGFPDLILWDPPTGKCLLVEVKGPNDKLSVTQTVWLENLVKFGANALVCHVENKSY